ncbi:hypothetical protein OTU49_007951 [Cherax quadricarinatus]|uniref:ER-bound oxygenase mpaB/mpaB'/Rubber oxygenase catalytic domain-containing protein n=1 Tax=Cherax quadricarinatus TaxID=27406 RepID=A0AAW0WS80_CHEQU
MVCGSTLVSVGRMTLLCAGDNGNSKAVLKCPLVTANDSECPPVKANSFTNDNSQDDGCQNSESSKDIRRLASRRANSELLVSPRMKELLEGLEVPGDSGNLPEEPQWLDRKLFNRGRQFYRRYLFCIFFSDLLALLMMFSMSRILKPLIYTERSDTILRALRRYVSTILHIITWYSGDVWDPNDRAHKDIMTVRSIHSNSARIFNSSTHYEKVTAIDVKNMGHHEPMCPLNPTIREDIEPQVGPALPLENPNNPIVYISQWDMLLTQYSFLGVMVAHPSKMGAWWASEEDLAGLIHFWRGIGFLLGIEDKYNFCRGTVKETQALCDEIEELIIKPRIAKADWNYEHMSSCLIEGINLMVPAVSYPAMFRFLADTLNIAVPAFVKRMSILHTCQYWLMRFVFHFLFLVPGIVMLFNGLLKLALIIAQGQYPARLSKTQNTVTSYTYT